MTFEEITNEWDKDSVLDKKNLVIHLLDIAILSHKYQKFLNSELKILIKEESNKKRLNRIKRQYFLCKLSDEERIKLNYPIFNIHLTAKDVDIFVDGDEEMILLDEKIKLLEKKIKYIENIMTTINYRTHTINTLLEVEKFYNGLNN